MVRNPYGSYTRTFSTHFMKKLLIILFVLISIDLYSQIESRKDWPKSIQLEFDLIKKQNIDTFLVYYTHLGPWTNLPDTCKEINSVSILWIKNNNYYSRQLYCDSITNNNIKRISSKPFRFFFSHIKDFDLRDKYYQDNNSLITISLLAAGFSETVIFKNALLFAVFSSVE